MSIKRIVDYHLTRLNDQRDNIRLEAIQELVLLDATEALDKLETIYRHDPIKEVRRAAKNAGKKLFAIQLLRNQNKT